MRTVSPCIRPAGGSIRTAQPEAAALGPHGPRYELNHPRPLEAQVRYGLSHFARGSSCRELRGWETEAVPIIHVTDPADERLADYRDLTDVALRRRIEPAAGLYMAEGAKVISRAIGAGHRPRSLLVTERWLDSVESLVDADTPVYVAPAAVLESVTGYDVHRGALAAMHRPVLASVADVVRDARLVVVLEGIVDHTNVGAIFRSVAGLGADAILVSPTCADPLYRRSVKVSMGTVFQVPWTRIEPWPADSTKRSRSSQLGLTGLCLRCDPHKATAMSAMPMGAPGWPELAACTASMARARIALAMSVWLAVLVGAATTVCTD